MNLRITRTAVPLFRACAVLLLIRAAGAVMSFDCSRKSLNISAISLLGPDECPSPDAIPPPYLQEVQILQRAVYYKVPVRTCRVELEFRIYSCRDTNMQHGEVNGGHDTRVHWITPGACNEMHDRGTASIYGNPITGIRVNNETNRWLRIVGDFGQDADCLGSPWEYNGVKYNRVAAAGNARIVLRSFDARVDVRTKTLILPSGVTCDLSQGNCRDITEGNVVWNQTPPATCSFDKLDVLYTGPANITTLDAAAHTSYLTVATTSSLTALIIKKIHPFILCNATAYPTNEPRVIVLFKGKEPFLFKKNKISDDNVDYMYYINSKALFLDWTIYSRVSASLAHAVHEHCLVERMRLEELLLLARLSSDPVAKLMKNSVGLTALERGNVLYIAQCEARNLRLRVDTKCWQQIPVWDGLTPAFLEPFSRIIVPAATEIDCSSVLLPQHWIDYQWVAFTPNITNASSVPVQSLSPTASAPEISPLVNVVGSAGAYDSNIIKELQTAFQFPAVRSAIFNDIARRASQAHSGPGSYGLTDLFNTIDIGVLTDSIFSRFFLFAATFGSYSSIFVTVCIIIFALRSLVESIVYGRLLAGVFGCGKVIIGSIWTSLGQAFLFEHERLVQKRGQPDSNVLNDHGTPRRTIHLSPVMSFNRMSTVDEDVELGLQSVTAQTTQRLDQVAADIAHLDMLASRTCDFSVPSNPSPASLQPAQWAFEKPSALIRHPQPHPTYSVQEGPLHFLPPQTSASSSTSPWSRSDTNT